MRRRYEVPGGFELSRLGAEMLGHASVRGVEEEPDLLALEVVLFDTFDHRLARQGVSLAYRSEGADAYWHVERAPGWSATGLEPSRYPGDDGGGSIVPGALASLLFARTRGADLGPVLRSSATRRTLRLLDRDGSLLAEVRDLAVRARRDPDGSPQCWREVETEVVSSRADGGLAGRLERLLLVAGGRPAVVTHLERAMCGRVRRTDADDADDADADADADDADAAGDGVGIRTGKGTAAVTTRIREQTEELLTSDLDVRRDRDDSVHRMRVALRRLLACLRSFRPLLDGRATDALAVELSWLARVLGAARDAEVLRARVLAALAGLPVVQVLGPVQATLGDQLLGAELTTRAAVREALASGRYAELLDRLVGFAETPPARDGRTDAGRARLRSLVARELAGLETRAEQARRAASGSREDALHALRKSAKRTRYTAETLIATEGATAARLATRLEKLQEVLGERHDGVVLLELLRREGARAGVRPGENGYTYGLLAGLELARLEGSEAAFETAWRRASEAAAHFGRRGPR